MMAVVAVAVLTLSMLAGSVGYVWADHCRGYAIGCEHEKLNVDIAIVNSTLSETPNGDTELTLWLQLGPDYDSKRPHNYVAIDYITTKKPSYQIPERCIAYPSDGEPLHIIKTTLLKACFTLPENVDVEDLYRLHAGYILESGFNSIITKSVLYSKSILLDLNPHMHSAVMCEAPPPTSTMTDGMPDVGSAAYHIYLNDIIVAFDGPVELAEGWRDHMTIRADNGTHTIEVDGLDQNTRNLMSPGSMVWLTLAFSDYQEFQDTTEITLLMGPGTILYGDDTTNAGDIVVGLEPIP